MKPPASPPSSRPFGGRFICPLALGAMLNPLNTSLIATAMVPIALAFEATPAQTSWLIASLALASAVAQPTLGRMADIFGPRRVFLAALMLVAAAGILGGLSSSLGMLVISRVLLGIGSSSAYPAAMCMFRDRAATSGVSPPPMAMGALSFSSLSVTAVGPVIGGILCAAFGWQAVFLVNFPLALGIMLLIWLWSPQDPPRNSPTMPFWASLDLPGITLFTLCLTGLLFFFMDLQHPSLLMLLLSLMTGLLLVLWSLRRPQPFIDVRMLAHNIPLLLTYARIALFMVICYNIFYGIAQWLQGAGGISSTRAGLVSIPMSIIGAAASFLGAKLPTLRLSFVLAAAASLAGSIFLLILNATSPLWLISFAMGFFGLPIGLVAIATQLAVYAQAPMDKIGTASGLQRTASCIGTIAASGLLAVCFGSAITDERFQTLMVVTALMSALLLVFTLVDPTLPRKKARHRAPNCGE